MDGWMGTAGLELAVAQPISVAAERLRELGLDQQQAEAFGNLVREFHLCGNILPRKASPVCLRTRRGLHCRVERSDPRWT